MTTKSVRDTSAAHARNYETVALVMQGGGALGAYQCGVYEALHDAGLRPDWLAGTSIGAINAAIIAGNAPEQRVARLREFWELICEPAGALDWPGLMMRGALAWLPDETMRSTWAGSLSAMTSLLQGQRGFFSARPLPPYTFSDGSAQATSFYDSAPLRDTLTRMVDFDRIHDDPDVRLTVGACCVQTGNMVYFDSDEIRLDADHILASCALPPAFAPVRIGNDLFWDGGLVSNTPLEHVLNTTPRRDTLALQVDLWSARGPRPQTMMDVLERAKDVQFSSRTRHGTDTVKRLQLLRTALNELLEQLPPDALDKRLSAVLEPWLNDRVFNIIHLIYQAKPHEEQFKDYAFG
ncbi:MAG: patatin-like phospholipase family protein, partial [Pseudomonadota bacterium]|nr:patatin-like phospholipase family protein [Pseudomonadota bacterium]